MDFLATDSATFTWVILPILIFLSRIADQTIGSLRIIFMSKGFKYVAPVLGFFEVIIWLVAVTQIIKHVDNPISYIAYGLGFATGTFIGMKVEERLSIGKVMVRIIPKMDTTELLQYMREQNYGITLMDAHGSHGDVKIIMSIMDRKDTRSLIPMINKFNPHAFFTIEDIRAVNEGVFPQKKKFKNKILHPGAKKIK